MSEQKAQSGKDKQFWKILEAVIRLEVSQGHLAWKMSDLSRQSGVNRPLIYYYFGKSKPAIVDTAIKVIGDEFFGLTEERVAMWKNGNASDSILFTRSLIQKLPYVVEFYLHWRHRDGEISKYFAKLEKRYLNKLVQLMPQRSKTEAEAIYAVIMGLSLVPDLKAETIKLVLSELGLS